MQVCCKDLQGKSCVVGTSMSKIHYSHRFNCSTSDYTYNSSVKVSSSVLSLVLHMGHVLNLACGDAIKKCALMKNALDTVMN